MLALMRYNIIDKDGTVSFVAPWNTLKALVAGCSHKPAPEDLSTLLEWASKYSSGLKDYVLNGLAVFDEHQAAAVAEPVTLSPELERDLAAILAKTPALPPAPPAASEEEETDQEMSYAELLERQARLRGAPLEKHPVLRVLDDETRHQSLEPVQIGLVIFNLPAKRIIQVQNSFRAVQRSDRGRFFENGQPTDRLYFYRLPNEWSLLP